MDSNNRSVHLTELIKTIRVPTKMRHLLAFGVAAVSLATMFVTSLATAQTPAAASKTKQETTTTATTAEKPEPLSGAQLWAMNCNRCHMARNPGEFTAAQWRTIIRHMRIRANLPAYQVKELQKYLEGGAGK